MENKDFGYVMTILLMVVAGFFGCVVVFALMKAAGG